MMNLSCVIFLSLLFNSLLTGCHKNIRSISPGGSDRPTPDAISRDLKGINSISEELINNEKSGEEEDEEEDEEGNTKTDFDSKAHRSLENAEREAVVDLEDIEIENLLHNEMFKIILERIKKLWYIGQCRRDYTSTCPIGWNPSMYDHSLCIPPKTYAGPCRSIDFDGASAKDKELFAWKCEAEWPCVKPYPRKVLSKCPNHWNQIGDKLCIAPNDYNGICPPAMDFSKIDFEMRTRMAQECAFEWPADIEAGVLNQQKTKYKSTQGGPVEESGEVIKIVHTPVYTPV